MNLVAADELSLCLDGLAPELRGHALRSEAVSSQSRSPVPDNILHQPNSHEKTKLEVYRRRLTDEPLEKGGHSLSQMQLTLSHLVTKHGGYSHIGTGFAGN